MLESVRAIGWKRLVVASCLLSALLFGGRALWRSLASDATKIRRLIAETAAAFDAASVGDVVAAFAEDYRDSTSGADREALRGAMLYLCYRRGEGVRHRVGLPEDEIAVAVEQGVANTTFVLTLHEVRGGDQERVLWQVEVTAGLRKTDDGWRFARSSHKTLAGRLPGR